MTEGEEKWRRDWRGWSGKVEESPGTNRVRVRVRMREQRGWSGEVEEGLAIERVRVKVRVREKEGG